MRRDTGKIVELPEVRQCAHPNVECAIHPGKSIAGVAVCMHVLDGAPVYLKEEPDRDRWGSVLCEACAFSAAPYQGTRIACEKCVRYHFSPQEEVSGSEPMSERDLLLMAEKDGLRQYRRSVRAINSMPAACPFNTPLMRDIWQVGFRLGQYLDECKQALPQTLAAKGETGSA